MTMAAATRNSGPKQRASRSITAPDSRLVRQDKAASPHAFRSHHRRLWGTEINVPETRSSKHVWNVP
jgi:hypothetical protein